MKRSISAVWIDFALAWALITSVHLWPVTAVAAPTENVSYTFEQSAVPIVRTERVALADVAVTMNYVSGTPADQYPDIRAIVADVLDYIQTYPDKKAYFEVIAKTTADRVLAAQKVVAIVRVTLSIRTDELRSYKRIVEATVGR